MKRKSVFRNSILVMLVAMLLFSCSQKQQQKKMPIQEIPVVTVIKHDVPIYDWYVGQIYGQKDIPIRARVDGFLESLEFQEGAKVTKGQLLYTIDPQSLEEASNAQRSKVTEAQTGLSKTRADLDRIIPLAESKAVSQSDLDAAQAAFDAAMANLNAAKANLRSSDINLSYTQVLSPIDGIIGKTEAQVGEYVGKAPNPVILNTVSEIDSIIVKFSITESQYIQLARRYGADGKNRANNTDRIPGIELQLADESIYKHLGQVDFVDRNVDQSTGSLLVQATFPNPDGLLRPGLYSKVKVMTDIKRDAIVIPQRCIIELQGSFSVFVVSDSNTVESRMIKVAYKSGDLAAITEGLLPNDRIVIDALQKVNSGMLISPVDTVFNSKVFKLKK